MDLLLILAQLTLGMLGVLGVTTRNPGLIAEQLSYILIAFVITAVISYIPPKRLTWLSTPAYFISLALLGLVLFIGVSTPGQHAQRWIPIGSFTLQPSELMKVAVILYLASFLHKHIGNWTLWRPMAVIGVASGLILVETDVSSALFIFVLALAILVVANTNIYRLFAIAASAAFIALAMFFVVLQEDSHVSRRWDVFIHHSNDSDLDYQPRMAKRAIKNSGLTGLGPGIPIFVPASETDMISVSIRQSLGITGILSLIVMYMMIYIRGLQIASFDEGPGSLLAAGAVIYVVGQAILNLLVSAGWLPITGVVLPFVSHGVNNLLSVSIVMGFIHSSFRASKKRLASQ